MTKPTVQEILTKIKANRKPAEKRYTLSREEIAQVFKYVKSVNPEMIGDDPYLQGFMSAVHLVEDILQDALDGTARY